MHRDRKYIAMAAIAIAVYWAVLPGGAVRPLPACAQDKSDTWKTLSPPNGRFSVLMPGRPEKNTHTEKAKDGSQTTFTGWFVDNAPKQVFAVAYEDVDLPAMSPSTRDSALSAIALEFASEYTEGGDKVVESHSISLQGYSGKAFTAEFKAPKFHNRKAMLQFHFYLVKHRIYFLIAGGVKSARNRAELARSMSKFFDSFKLLQ